jgi:hypothetical protein
MAAESYDPRMANKRIYPSQDFDRFIVRMPPGMRERLRQAAEASDRSMNAEIVRRIEAAEESNTLSEQLSASLESQRALARELSHAQERFALSALLIEMAVGPVLADEKAALSAESKTQLERLHRTAQRVLAQDPGGGWDRAALAMRHILTQDIVDEEKHSYAEALNRGRKGDLKDGLAQDETLESTLGDRSLTRTKKPRSRKR